MSKTPFVLQALKILGLEEMLKLSEVLHTKKIPLKKVVGQDLVIWDDHPASGTKKDLPLQEEAKVLFFPEIPATAPAPSAETQESVAQEQEVAATESDLYLWRQELNKQHSEKASQQSALKGYRKTNEIYLVKSKDENGKTQVRYAAIEGVLVNKKQA